MESSTKNQSQKTEPNLQKQLEDFRENHHPRNLLVTNVQWQYFSSGNSEKVFLLLPGGMGAGEALFTYIMEFEKNYKVISPSIPRVSTISEIIEGLSAILKAENVKTFSVLGQSFGGILAQELVRRYPEKVNKLILSHTTTSTDSIGSNILNSYTKRLKKAINMVNIVPISLLKVIFKKKIVKLTTKMSSDHRSFWLPYFCELISHKTKDDEIATYSSMLDFALNYSYTSADFSDFKGKVLILDSESDESFDLIQKRAIKELFTNASTHSFHDTGHLSIFTVQDEFIKIVKKFLEE